MITCPTCIAARARAKSLVLKTMGYSPERITETLNRSYGQGFSVRASENAIYYVSRIGTEHLIRRFQ